jgi:hypothetical protein
MGEARRVPKPTCCTLTDQEIQRFSVRLTLRKKRAGRSVVRQVATREYPLAYVVVSGTTVDCVHSGVFHVQHDCIMAGCILGTM